MTAMQMTKKLCRPLTRYHIIAWLKFSLTIKQLVLQSYTDAIVIENDGLSAITSTDTPVNPNVVTKTTEAEMKRLLFIGTDRNLELHNTLKAEDIAHVLFSSSIQQCTYLCKRLIGNDHFNNHVNRYETHSGKCTCYLFNRCQQQFQSTLHDFSWSPKQTRYHYSAHRNIVLTLIY